MTEQISKKTKNIGIAVWGLTLVIGILMPIFIVIPSLAFGSRRFDNMYIVTLIREVLNFAVTMTVLYPLIFLAYMYVKLDLIIYLTYFIIFIFSVIGTFFAIKGEIYRVPFAFKFFK